MKRKNFRLKELAVKSFKTGTPIGKVYGGGISKARTSCRTGECCPETEVC